MITVYSRAPCGYCDAAKRLLSREGHEFVEVDLTADPEGFAGLVARSGMMTVPQIFRDDELIGGFDQLRAAVAAGSLTPA